MASPPVETPAASPSVAASADAGSVRLAPAPLAALRMRSVPSAVTLTAPFGSSASSRRATSGARTLGNPGMFSARATTRRWTLPAPSAMVTSNASPSASVKGPACVPIAWAGAAARPTATSCNRIPGTRRPPVRSWPT